MSFVDAPLNSSLVCSRLSKVDRLSGEEFLSGYNGYWNVFLLFVLFLTNQQSDPFLPRGSSAANLYYISLAYV